MHACMVPRAVFSLADRVRFRKGSVRERKWRRSDVKSMKWKAKPNTSASTISANINSIPMLNETNFRDLKENAMIVLGCMDLDLVPRIEQPTALTDKSSKTFRGSVSEKVTTAKKFLEAIEKHFAKNKSK
uniref:Uncharacterized protein n=1 Tax=Populus trichocarpa TaxID=3694 RepID=B9GRY9_POPTR